MINYINNPEPCVFSKNPVNFKLFASNFSAETNVFPSITLKFNYKFQTGYFFKIKFKNPITNAIEEIVFITSVNPTEDGSQIPGMVAPSVAVDNAYVQDVAKHMRLNTILSSYYEIEVSSLSIKVKAREGVKELIPFGYYTNFEGSAPITATISGVYWKARKRPGHRININVYFEKEYRSNVFELVSAQNDHVDINGFQNIDVASILDSEIKDSFENPPLPNFTNPNDTNIVQKAKVLRRFYIEVSEQWKDMKDDVKWEKSEIYNVHFGGVSMDDFSRYNPFNYLASEKAALTWWRDKKRLYPEQNDWISAMNLSTIDDLNFNAKLDILYKDGTSDNFSLGGQPLLAWETITIPVGYKQLNIESKQDYSKEVYGWKVTVYNNNNEEQVSRTYLLHQPKNFKTNTIVYLNSFGVAESFVCSGFFENNLVTSAEIATKTLKHDYKSINGRDFVFNKNSRNTFKARSGVLNKAECDALQSMLNVAPVFLLEKDLLRPIIIDTGSFVIDNESEITKTLDFKITKSLELTNVSEMKTKPVLEVSENCGMFKIKVKSDNEIESFGDLTIENNSAIMETITPSGDEYIATIKAEDNGIYLFKCTVDTDEDTYDLESSYSFRRKAISFNTPNHTDPFNVTALEIVSSVAENIIVSSQNGSPTTYTTIPINILSIIEGVKVGVTKHELTASCFNNVYKFEIRDQEYRDFNLSALRNLNYLTISNCNIPGQFSTAEFRELRRINLTDNNINHFELGMNLKIYEVLLQNNNLNASSIESLFIELYDYRKLFTLSLGYNIIINLSGNPGVSLLSANALAIKNGTGKYSGDGLTQNNINIIY